MRLEDGRLPPKRRAQIADAFERHDVLVSVVFLLEAGYSARHGQEHTDMMRELARLDRAEIDTEVSGRAVDMQGQLARTGHHRLPPVDLLTAALAERHGLTVLHYDKDYDIIAAKTDAVFDGEWVATRGSL